MLTYQRVTSVIGRLLGQSIPALKAPPGQTRPRPYSGPKYPIPGLPWTAEFIASKAFLKTWEWRSVAYDTLKRYGRRCMMCGRTPHQHGIAVNVDHIKSRKNRPDLALDPSNLQVLCDEDNHGKGNRHSDDWR